LGVQAELNDLSEMNVPDVRRLPQLMEMYDLQTSGVVGLSSFKARRLIMDEGLSEKESETPLLASSGQRELQQAELQQGELQQTELQQRELQLMRLAQANAMKCSMKCSGQADTNFGVGYGLLPAFGDVRPTATLAPSGIPVGATGSFRSPLRAQPHKLSYRSGAKTALNRGSSTMRDSPSPNNHMGPWGVATEMMDRSFDSSTSWYRPGKVIRSLDQSVKPRKPLSQTMNPRLVALEISPESEATISFSNMELMHLSNSSPDN